MGFQWTHLFVWIFILWAGSIYSASKYFNDPSHLVLTPVVNFEHQKIVKYKCYHYIIIKENTYFLPPQKEAVHLQLNEFKMTREEVKVFQSAVLGHSIAFGKDFFFKIPNYLLLPLPHKWNLKLGPGCLSIGREVYSHSQATFFSLGFSMHLQKTCLRLLSLALLQSNVKKTSCHLVF